MNEQDILRLEHISAHRYAAPIRTQCSDCGTSLLPPITGQLAAAHRPAVDEMDARIRRDMRRHIRWCAQRL